MSNQKVVVEFLCDRNAWNYASLEDRKEICLHRFQAEHEEFNWTIERIPEYCMITSVNFNAIMVTVEASPPPQNLLTVQFPYDFDEWRMESLYGKKYICLTEFGNRYPELEWDVECMPDHWLISRVDDDLIEIRVKAIPR